MILCAEGAGGDALLADLGLVLGARGARGAPAGELAVRTARRLLALACDAVRHTATLSSATAALTLSCIRMAELTLSIVQPTSPCFVTLSCWWNPLTMCCSATRVTAVAEKLQEAPPAVRKRGPSRESRAWLGQIWIHESSCLRLHPLAPWPPQFAVCWHGGRSVYICYQLKTVLMT